MAVQTKTETTYRVASEVGAEYLVAVVDRDATGPLRQVTVRHTTPMGTMGTLVVPVAWIPALSDFLRELVAETKPEDT